MRDDRHRWDAQLSHQNPITIGNVTLQEVQLERQLMVSGTDVPGKFGPAVGWPDIASGDTYTLSLRRDRVVIVNGPAMTTGWDPQSQNAVSDVTDGFRVFDLVGATALDVLQRGAEVSLDVSSASVARLLFQMNCLLYRIENENKFRVHVARGLGQALYQNLHTTMGVVAEKSS